MRTATGAIAGRATVCALVGCALLVLGQLYVAIPLAPVLATAFGAGEAGAAAALGAAFFAYAGGFLVFGPLSDRYGRRAILLPGLGALAAVTAALAAAPSLEAVAVLRLAQGFAAGCFSPAALAYLGEALPHRSRAVAIGAVSTAYLVAGIGGQVYADAVAAAFGWRWVFVLGTVGIVVALVWVAAVMREAPRQGTPEPLGERLRRIGRLVVRRDVALPCVGVFAVMLSFVAMYSALGPHLANVGLDEGDLVWVRLGGLPGMCVAPFAGAFVARFGTTRTAVAGFLLAAAGLAVEATAGGSLWMLVAATNVFVAGVAVVSTALVTLFGDRAGTARGAGTSLYGFVLFCGASTGPYAARLGLGFEMLSIALAVLMIFGACSLILAKPLTFD